MVHVVVHGPQGGPNRRQGRAQLGRFPSGDFPPGARERAVVGTVVRGAIFKALWRATATALCRALIEAAVVRRLARGAPPGGARAGGGGHCRAEPVVVGPPGPREVVEVVAVQEARLPRHRKSERGRWVVGGGY